MREPLKTSSFLESLRLMEEKARSDREIRKKRWNAQRSFGDKIWLSVPQPSGLTAFLVLSDEDAKALAADLLSKTEKSE